MLDEIEPHEDHDIGPKRPGSIANSVRYLAAWRRLGRFDEDAAVAAIGRARELGVNFFDTAQAYGFGASERILGRALRDERLPRRIPGQSLRLGLEPVGLGPALVAINDDGGSGVSRHRVCHRRVPVSRTKPRCYQHFLHYVPGPFVVPDSRRSTRVNRCDRSCLG